MGDQPQLITCDGLRNIELRTHVLKSNIVLTIEKTPAKFLLSEIIIKL